MSYTEDPDLWQPETAKVGAIAQDVAPTRQSRANPAASDADQRRIDLKTIMELLSRAANDLRAAERRAVLAEEKAARAENLVKEANERLRAAEERAESHARKVQENSKSALRKIDTHAFEIEKAAKSRNQELEERLRTAETRLEAVRSALGPDQAPRAAFCSEATFLPPADDLLSLRVHH